MAEMFPRELLAEEVKSNGERKVFEVLRDELAAPWQAYHSVSWVARDHAKGAIDGEIDFVLCHPEQGILCLEVKGGNLDSRGGSWFTGPQGAQAQIRDPFTQALDHRYSLERHIVGASIAGAREWLIGQAIVLPDVTVHELALAPDAQRELIIDRIDLRDVQAAIERVIAYHRGSREQRKAPGAEGALALRNLLVPAVTLRVPLAEEVVEEEVALIGLTEDQGVLLARMSRTPRLAITGCAGSGKTMLAVEHAKRLAEAGTNVLFVCFNKALQQHLRDRERTSGIDFYTFHGLCTHLAKRAGIDLPANDLPLDYFERVLPEALLEAASELGPQYGALIVDEAQDLEDEWFETLLYLLEDEKKGNVWLFFDDNQRIFESGFSPGGDFLRFDLNVNCRNTQSIHREVIKHYEGSVVPEVRGPLGREVELHRSDDQPQAVASVIERLCGEGEIPPQDVVVLSGHGVENSLVYKSMQGDYSLTRKRGELGSKVFFSSIRGFKGLESPVVILCELEELDDTREQQLYVGLSRARSHCVVVGSEPLS
jgi:hypothetical protein